MPIRRMRLEGPAVTGRRLSATLLRDVLAIVIEGSQKAVRLRTQGRSTARGAPPAWIPAASEFVVEIKEGSTILEIEAPTLHSADPEGFSQRSLFPDIEPDLTSFDYLVASLSAAVHAEEESPLVDPPMIQLLARLEDVFERGVEGIRFEANATITLEPLTIRASDVKSLAGLEKQIPAPQYVRVAGKLDIIRHSDGTFYLALPAGERVRGIAHQQELQDLQGLWGTRVLVAGTAYFSPAGRVLRVEAQVIRAATEKDARIWGIVPEPLGVDVRAAELRISQGPKSGLNAIYGKWPGDEDDETILGALEAMS